MSGSWKKNQVLIKNLAFIICLIVTVFQFVGSFKELIQLVETNQLYVQVPMYGEPAVPSWGPMNFSGFSMGAEERGQSGACIKVDTLNIYTYKLFQTILLLFGVFMCLIFLAINNHNFSIINLIEEHNK